MGNPGTAVAPDIATPKADPSLRLDKTLNSWATIQGELSTPSSKPENAVPGTSGARDRWGARERSNAGMERGKILVKHFESTRANARSNSIFAASG